jgi:kynureninase
MALDPLAHAKELDRNDPLAHFREAFVHASDEQLIYMDGNSLGKLPKQSQLAISEAVSHQWGQRLIRSWNEHWIKRWKDTAAAIASLVGAHADEIFVTDSTSVNLYKLAFAALKAQQNRSQILTDSYNFPSDLYIFEGLKGSFKDLSVQQLSSAEHPFVDETAIEKALNPKTALLSLSLVTFQSAYFYDMARINAVCKENGTLNLWDLSHATGAVPIDLNASGADLAVGCTYKYMNAGPGAPAFLYVRRSLQKQLFSPIQGWFGHAKPFDFSADFEPAPDASRFAAGTPPMLSLIGVHEGAKLLNDAGMQNVRSKSIGMSELFHRLFEDRLKALGFDWASPLDTAQRGSHVSLIHQEAWRVNRALIEPLSDSDPKIIPDFRPPHYLRIGFTPLYTSYEEVVVLAERLEQIIANKEYERFDGQRHLVP